VQAHRNGEVGMVGEVVILRGLRRAPDMPAYS
jgi:hypothetical protein